MEDGTADVGRDDAPGLEGVVVSVPPRFRSVPPRASSLGPDAVKFAERAGLQLDGHQVEILDGFLGRRQNGGWASFENALVEPRQNGKTETLLVRVLFGAFELEEKHVVYSAHMWATAHEAFLRAVDVIESTPHLAERIAKIRRSAADLGFILSSGERIRFLTRSRATARGFSGELIVFDEAHFLAEATHSALLPTLSARSAKGQVQVFYGCSAADQTRHPDALVMARLRERGIAGDDPSLAFFEWSAAVLDEDGHELAPDLVPDDVAADPAVWRAANPACPARIAEEHIGHELRGLDRRSFSTERLGVGDWPAGDSGPTGPLHLEDWLALVDEKSEPIAPVCVGFDISPDRRVSIAVAGRRRDGLFHVEIVDARQGTGQLVDRVTELVERHDPWVVAADPYGLGGVLIERIEEQAQIEIRKVSAGELAQACGLLLDLVSEAALRHLGSGELVDAIKGASTRALADAWVWSRKNSSVDISPLVAGTLALWACAGMPTEDNDWRIW